MVELTGGPGDGKRLEFDKWLCLPEKRKTCTNPDHVEVRIHIYDELGRYFGVSPWHRSLQEAVLEQFTNGG